MIELITLFFLSLLPIAFYLWIPGLLVKLWFIEENSVSLSELFFWSWTFITIMTCLLIPFASTTQLLSTIEAIIIAMLILVSIAVWGIQGKSGQKWGTITQIVTSTTSIHFGIFLITLFLFISFVVTHNLGFDDTSNLSYLLKSIDGKPFHTFIPLNKYFSIQLSNYPFFGVILGILSTHIQGSGFFIYYTIGFFILYLFIITCYNHIKHKVTRPIQSISLLALIFLILGFLGWDNYFNFCVYPLQQAKLLFLAGLVYIINFFVNHKHPTRHLFLGFSLCTAASLHHTNIIILYVTLIILLVAVSILSKQTSKKIISLLAIPMLLLFAGFYPDKGFINFDNQIAQKSIKEMSVKVKKAESQNHEKKTRLAQDQQPKAKALTIQTHRFAKYFNRLKLRFKRVLTLEIIFIPFVIIFGHFAFRTGFLNIAFLIISGTAMFFLFTTKVPKQAIISFYYSSPFLMAYDIYSSKDSLSSKFRYLSDPYTSLFLKLLLGLESKPLGPVSELLFFSPLFKPGAEQFATSMGDISDIDRTVHNIRYWGLSSLNRIPEISSSFKEHNAHLNITGDRSDLFSLAKFIPNLNSIIKNKVKRNLVIKKVPKRFIDYPGDLKNYLTEQSVASSFFNDAAIIQIDNISPKTSWKIGIRFHGDWLRYFPLPSKTVIPEPLLLSGNHASRKWNPEQAGISTYRITTDKTTKNALLLFRVSGQGFISGLGFIKSVSLKAEEAR